MRIVVLTDVHANLPALDAALAKIQQEGYDLLVHTGDAISIGPFPAESLERLLALPNARFVMGNHDAWFAHGLPTPQPPWMSDGEVLHQQWTHAQLNPALRAEVAQWPAVVTARWAGVPLTFLHYPLVAPGEFLPIIAAPTVADLDRIFSPYAGELICYGHHHPFSDVQGRARYLNPGSLGCAPTAVARYCVIDLIQQQWTVTHHSVPYDDAPLQHAFAARAVPERHVITQIFFGSRFQLI